MIREYGPPLNLLASFLYKIPVTMLRNSSSLHFGIQTPPFFFESRIASSDTNSLASNATLVPSSHSATQSGGSGLKDHGSERFISPAALSDFMSSLTAPRSSCGWLSHSKPLACSLRVIVRRS